MNKQTKNISLTTTQRRLNEAAMRLFAERGSLDITVSDLSREAGVARGTIYNNIADPERLFEGIAEQLANDMLERAVALMAAVDDPAERVSIGVRLYVRQAHDSPHWGRFILRFVFSSSILRELWQGQPTQDLAEGVRRGRFSFTADQIPSALGILTGGTLSAINLVLEGHKTWREAGSETVAIMLRGFGVPGDDADRIANQALPD